MCTSSFHLEPSLVLVLIKLFWRNQAPHIDLSSIHLLPILRSLLAARSLQDGHLPSLQAARSGTMRSDLDKCILLTPSLQALKGKGKRRGPLLAKATPKIWGNIFHRLPILDRGNLAVTCKKLACFANRQKLLYTDFEELFHLYCGNYEVGNHIFFFQHEVVTWAPAIEINYPFDKLLVSKPTSNKIQIGMREFSDLSGVRIPDLNGKDDPFWAKVKQSFINLEWLYSPAARLVIASELRRNILCCLECQDWEAVLSRGGRIVLTDHEPSDTHAEREEQAWNNMTTGIALGRRVAYAYQLGEKERMQYLKWIVDKKLVV